MRKGAKPKAKVMRAEEAFWEEPPGPFAAFSKMLAHPSNADTQYFDFRISSYVSAVGPGVRPSRARRGAGGMTAALVSAVEGRRTLVIERSGQVGGTTARVPRVHARDVPLAPERPQHPRHADL